MEGLFDIDWRALLVPQESVLAMFVRGTVMYLALFTLLRIFPRGSGSVSIADILVIVIIADAAQHGMAGEAKSITEALALVCTIIFWDYFIDWLGFKSKLMGKVLEPEPVILIKAGRVNRGNLEKHMITDEELLSQLRQQGVDEIEKVKECRLESGGEFSVVTYEGSTKKGKKADKHTGDLRI